MEFVTNSDGYLNRNPPLSTYPDRSVLTVDEELPFIRFLYTDYERGFSAADGLRWNIVHYNIAPVVVVCYLLFCYFGKRFMKNRKAFDLRVPLKYWNLLLAIFSLIGSIRIVPQLFLIIKKWGFESSICSPPVYAYGHGAAGLWTLLFNYSKFVELLDTVFIILRKRQLSFLHWYHHATVLLYTWDAYCWEQPAGIYFVAMNYSVHAVMYFYYYLSAQLQRPLSWGIFVTIVQISQMFVGMGVTVVSVYYAFNYPYRAQWTLDLLTDPLSHGQYITVKNLYWACLMYSTYFYLFAEYFVKRYLSGNQSGAVGVNSQLKPGKVD